MQRVTCPLTSGLIQYPIHPYYTKLNSLSTNPCFCTRSPTSVPVTCCHCHCVSDIVTESSESDSSSRYFTLIIAQVFTICTIHKGIPLAFSNAIPKKTPIITDKISLAVIPGNVICLFCCNFPRSASSTKCSFILLSSSSESSSTLRLVRPIVTESDFIPTSNLILLTQETRAT